MSSRKSKVWCYFSKINEKRANCNICKTEVASSGGTTNMSTHLRRHHQIDVTLPASQPTAQVKSVDKGQNAGTATSNVPSNPWTLSCQGKLPTTTSNEITNAVLYYIIHDLRPFSTIESPAFRSMLSSLNPRYQPPSRHTVAEKLIPALVEKETSFLMKDLDEAVAVALTSDGWTSRSADSYLTITCHYLKEWKLISKVLQTEHFHGSHTGENVGIELKHALAKWQITDKVKVITVDNASNMTAAIRVSGVDLKLGCFAHTLNLASNKVLNIQSLGKVLGKVRSVVTFFHKSCIGTEYLKMKQSALGLPAHKLIIDCKTRWNSTFNMLQRFLEQRPAILATLLDERVKGVSAKANIAGLSDFEIHVCEVFVKEMDVMVTATLALSEEKSPTVGLILPLLDKLRKHFTPDEEEEPFTKSLKQAVGADLAGRYSDPGLLAFLEEASALDPRTKTKSCVNDSTWERVGQKALTSPAHPPTLVKQEPMELPGPNVPDLPAVPELSVDPVLSQTEEATCSKSDVNVKIEPESQKKSALESLFDEDVQFVQEELPLPLN